MFFYGYRALLFLYFRESFDHTADWSQEALSFFWSSLSDYGVHDNIIRQLTMCLTVTWSWRPPNSIGERD
jgi:hypothetical protein